MSTPHPYVEMQDITDIHTPNLDASIGTAEGDRIWRAPLNLTSSLQTDKMEPDLLAARNRHGLLYKTLRYIGLLECSVCRCLHLVNCPDDDACS